MADIELSPTGSSPRIIYAKAGDGTPIDLTGYSASIAWRATDGQPDGGQDAVTIATPATGVCEFTFSAQAMRLRRGVEYAVRIVVDDGNGNVTPLGAEGGAALTMRVGEV